jgi:two-component system, sporulation sensor kinase E
MTSETGGMNERNDPRGEEQAGMTMAAGAREVAIIASMLAAITILHLFTSPARHELHLLYRSIYFLPILYAAWTFGAVGGFSTAIVAGVLYGLHAQNNLGGLLGANIDNAFEIVMYLVVGGLFGRLRDIEEHKTSDLRRLSHELEEAYRTLEERAVQLINIRDYTQSILRSTTTGVITIGPDGSIATVNLAAERMLGMTEADMVPKTIQRLFDEDGAVGADVTKVIEGRLPRAAREARLVTRHGRIIHVQASVSRMQDIHGGILGAVVTLEDVSEVKALTEQLIRADRLAAMGELTAGVAHEVRNPLGIIRASVQLMEDSQCQPERILEASAVIKQEIDRLDRVVKALLDFGRPSSPTLRPTGVGDVLDDVVLFTRKFASRGNVRIVEERATGLPDVLADPDQLKQVFVNLISNAVQAMEEEGGTLTIATSLNVGFVEVAFSDDGPGIPPSRIGKVFDPFYSTRDEGTGLGLTIVHRIVDEHDGHIEVRSTYGGGTVFTVSLPALRESVSAGDVIGGVEDRNAGREGS